MTFTHKISCRNSGPAGAPQAQREASAAGTRAMIADEQFAALVGLLVRKNVLSGRDANSFLCDLAGRIERPAHSDWQLNAWELRLHADWLKRLGARLWTAMS